MRLITLSVTLLAVTAHAGWNSPSSLKLTAGALGTVRLIKDADTLVLEVYFPREWTEGDVKLGTKITPRELLILADADGVFYEGPAPTFVTSPECENDGGTYSEPVARLVLDRAQLLHQPSTRPFGGEKNIGMATLGRQKRKPLQRPATRRTLLRVDFDGDGAPDAELRSAPSEAGCGRLLEEDALVAASATAAFSARCCGP